MLHTFLWLLPVFLAGAVGYYLGLGRLSTQPANKEAKTIYADANVKNHQTDRADEIGENQSTKSSHDLQDDSLVAAAASTSSSSSASSRSSTLSSSTTTTSSLSSPAPTSTSSSTSLLSSDDDASRSTLRQRMGLSRRASGGTHWPPIDSDDEHLAKDEIIPAADADQFDEDEQEKERVLDHMKKEHEKHVSLFQHEGLEGTKPKGKFTGHNTHTHTHIHRQRTQQHTH